MLRLFLIAVFCASASSQADEAAPKGHLVVVGGGKTIEAVMRRMLELAGGPDATIVILPQASAVPETGAKSEEIWRGFGASNVTATIDLNSASAKQALARAALIWMPGGAQTRLMKALTAAGIPEILRERYHSGAVIGGTSAGAAVMSALMITGEADLESITPGATKLAEGLGLWAEVIVDQHFLKRQRFNRLLAVVLDHPDKIGVGIDEETAVIVSADGWKVVGNSKVLIIDARGVSQEKAKGSKTELHLLSAGMIWRP